MDKPDNVRLLEGLGIPCFYCEFREEEPGLFQRRIGGTRCSGLTTVRGTVVGEADIRLLTLVSPDGREQARELVDREVSAFDWGTAGEWTVKEFS